MNHRPRAKLELIAKLNLIAMAVLTLAAAPAPAVQVLRGPYLQLGTPRSIIVQWRTDDATDSRVRYGTRVGSLDRMASNPTIATDHALILDALPPNTIFYYAVGSSAGDLAGDNPDYYFVTAPPAGAPRPTRVWVLGDSGTADENALAVRDAYLSYTGARHTDLWLMLGDNAYHSGTDSEYQAAVFDIYPTVLRTSALWPTFGNHDAISSDSSTQSGPYYEIFSMPTRGEAGGMPSGTKAYYSFDFGNIHFICLDSQGSSRLATGAMMTWLRADLASTAQQWIIAFWHHPPYSKGSHDSDIESRLVQMRENALPILEAGGVDLVLTGHSHSYERSFLLDGHYGLSSTLTAGMIRDSGDGREDGTGAYRKPTSLPAPHQGAVYAVAGSSGQTSGGLLNHPAMFISLNNLGSMVLDVNGNRLNALFLRENGAIDDHFTVVKGTAGAEEVASDSSR